MPGLGFAQVDPQPGMPRLQRRQQPRQHIGRERRDDAEPERAGQQAGAMPGEILKIAGGAEDPLGALRHLGPDLGQDRLAGAPLDQRDPEILLELLDLHRQGRLAHGAGLRRPPEMAVLGQRIEIAELSERQHIDKIILSTS